MTQTSPRLTQFIGAGAKSITPKPKTKSPTKTHTSKPSDKKSLARTVRTPKRIKTHAQEKKEHGKSGQKTLQQNRHKASDDDSYQYLLTELECKYADQPK